MGWWKWEGLAMIKGEIYCACGRTFLIDSIIQKVRWVGARTYLPSYWTKNELHFWVQPKQMKIIRVMLVCAFVACIWRRVGSIFESEDNGIAAVKFYKTLLPLLTRSSAPKPKCWDVLACWRLSPHVQLEWESHAPWHLSHACIIWALQVRPKT